MSKFVKVSNDRRINIDMIAFIKPITSNDLRSSGYNLEALRRIYNISPTMVRDEVIAYDAHFAIIRGGNSIGHAVEILTLDDIKKVDKAIGKQFAKEEAETEGK